MPMVCDPGLPRLRPGRYLLRLVAMLLLALSGPPTMSCSNSPRVASMRRDCPAGPSFRLRDLKGQLVGLCDYRGKVLLVVFWGACCQNSKAVLAAAQDLWLRHGRAGLEMVSIAKDPPDRESEVRQVVRRHRYRFPVLLDQASEASDTFNPAMAFPFLVLFDRQGRVVLTHEGFKPGDEKIIERRIEELLGQPGPFDRVDPLGGRRHPQQPPSPL